MDRISKHISYKEGTSSMTARSLGLPNVPTKEHLLNMQAVGEKVFEPLRSLFADREGFDGIRIESFYRSEQVNKMTRGASKNSQHRFGQAIDIDDDYGTLTNAEMFKAVIENLQWDQLIWEFGSEGQPDWVHVSYKLDGMNRRRITRAHRGAIYVHYDTVDSDPKTHYQKACAFHGITPIA